MQKINPAVIKELDLPARRALVVAAKAITKFRITAVTTDFGIHSSNLYAFLSGTGNSIGVKAQFQVMRNYGFGVDGRLLPYLHSWSIEDDESWAHLAACLSHEVGVASVSVERAFTSEPNKEFVGALFCIDFESSVKPAKFILTNNCVGVVCDEFLQLARRSLAKSLGVADFNDCGSFEISRDSAIEVWRWQHCRTGGRSKPRPVPPKTSLLDYATELKIAEELQESAQVLLEKILPRFEKLSIENARLRGIRQSSWDLSFIGRARKALGR